MPLDPISVTFGAAAASVFLTGAQLVRTAWSQRKPVALAPASRLCLAAAPARTAPPVRIAPPEEKSPEEHAAALLAWLQGDNGLVGTVSSVAAIEAYHSMLVAHYWAERPWTAVGSAFARLPGVQKKLASRNGKRYRAYWVPAAADAVRPDQLARAA